MPTNTDKKTVALKRGLGKNLALTLLYIAAGALGQALPSVEFSLSLWIPSGIAVVALLRWGNTCLPGVLLGATLLGLFNDLPWGPAFLEALGSVLGAWLTVFLLGKFGFSATFLHRRDVSLLLLSFCFLLCCVVCVVLLGVGVGVLFSLLAAAFFFWGFVLMGVGGVFGCWGVFWVGLLRGVVPWGLLLLSNRKRGAVASSRAA